MHGDRGMGTSPAVLRGRPTKIIGVGGEILAQIGLEMADGQIHQADYALSGHVGRGRNGTPLVVALEHLRSACCWLTAAAKNVGAA